ncbi:hypothetical protein BN938_2114 [Mucinivorans hirudinis]|uniref:Uncharacterized protein n=1 Tax=Mucinivorans hirudinis TaxID=1433126 RepID=A0A060R9D3_9BACT|nr:hypothetical protein BN938_2114 [Mucinivorans hirudinis]
MLLLFVAIAAALWYINKLTYRYRAEVTIPIHITVDHQAPGWVENPNFSVTCLVSGVGGEILRRKLSSGKIDIQLSALSLNQAGEDVFSVTAASLRDALTSAQNKFDVVQVLDTIPYLKITPLFGVNLPVRDMVSVNCAKQYMQVGTTTFSPAEIFARVPRSMVDTLKAINTEVLTIYDAYKSLSGNVGLVIPEGVILSQQQVRYSVDIAGYTELEYRLPVTVLNFAQQGGEFVNPSQVSALIRVPLTTLRSEYSLDPVAVVDCGDLSRQRTNMLKVSIISLPKGGEVAKITPQFVEFFQVRQ